MIAITHGQRKSVAVGDACGGGVGWTEARKPHRLSQPPVPCPSLPTVPATMRGAGGRGVGIGEGEATVATTDRSRTVILHKPNYFLKHN